MDCKHVFATQIHSLEKAKKEITVRSSEKFWANYNEAQTKEWQLFGDLLNELVKNVPELPRTPGKGRKPIPIGEQIYVSLLKVYSQQSLRRASGLFERAVEEGHLSKAPNFNTPSFFLNRKDTTEILRKLLQQTAIPLNGIENHFSVDSSGFTTSTFFNWNNQKHRKNTRIHDNLKAHISVGVKTGIISDAIISGPLDNDHPFFDPLVRKTAEEFDIEEVSADKAYLSKHNLQLVDDLGATPYIPYKTNSNARSNGCPMWKKMYYRFKLERDSWDSRYHLRSNVESAFGAIKAKFGEKLLSKNDIAQVNELYCKLIAYNLCIIIRSMFDFGIDVDF